jgi:hypothetical protein
MGRKSFHDIFSKWADMDANAPGSPKTTGSRSYGAGADTAGARRLLRKSALPEDRPRKNSAGPLLLKKNPALAMAAASEDTTLLRKNSAHHLLPNHKTNVKVQPSGRLVHHFKSSAPTSSLPLTSYTPPLTSSPPPLTSPRPLTSPSTLTSPTHH